MEIDDPSGIEGINVKSAGASVQFSLSLVFALLLALHHA